MLIDGSVMILQVSNVTLIPPNKIEFDFLGKDSIQYHNTVTVDPKVYKNVDLFRRKYQNGTGMHFAVGQIPSMLYYARCFYYLRLLSHLTIYRIVIICR